MAQLTIYGNFMGENIKPDPNAFFHQEKQKLLDDGGLQ